MDLCSLKHAGWEQQENRAVWKSTLLYSVLGVIQLYSQKQIGQVKQFLTIFSWGDEKNKEDFVLQEA